MKLFKILLNVILIFIAIGALLYATNPTKADFIEYSKSEMSESIVSSRVTSNGFVDQMIGSVAGSVSSSIANVIYRRNDYEIFSIYEARNFDFEYQYIGIANHFFVLKDNLDMDAIDIDFADIINSFSKKELCPEADSINILSKKETIQEDEYAYYKFDISKYRDVEFRVKSISGSDFEMAIFDKDNFGKYIERINGKSVDSIKVVYQSKVLANGSNKETFTLWNGTYVVLVDNTDKGLIKPPMNLENDSVTYNLEIDLK